MEILICTFESVKAYAFHPVLQYNYRHFVIHSKYLKHFSIFNNKETMTSISNTTSKHCLITPCVCVGGGGGGQLILL